MGIEYVELTTECNMKCEHCCVDAKAKGTRMTRETLVSVCNFLEAQGEAHVTVGGGEPTLHPDFIPMIEKMMEINLRGNYINVAVITNGTRINKIKQFLKLQERYNDQVGELLIMELSTDDYHDRSMVSDWVWEYFTSRKLTHGRSSYEFGNDGPVPVGRAKKNDLGNLFSTGYRGTFNPSRRCVCTGNIVRANGDVVPCGCDDVPILGNVNTPDDKLKDALRNYGGGCWNANHDSNDWQEFKEAYGYAHPELKLAMG